MIVLCSGVFDLLHVAHKRYFEQASQWGEVVVGVTRDLYVGKKGRPIIPEDERLEMIKSLKCVSDATLVNDSIDALIVFEPDIFCKGHDYKRKGLLASEIEYCKAHDILIRFTKENPQTTTGIIERCYSLRSQKAA